MQEKQQESTPEQSPVRAKAPGSIAKKFNLAIAALVLLCMSIFWLISNYYIQNMLRQQADTLGMKLAVQAASLVTEPVLANDPISINVLLNQLTRDSTIVEAAVLNIDGGVIARSFNTLYSPRSLIPVTPVFGEYQAPISLRDSVAGEVRIRLDLSYIEQGLLNNFLFLAAATLILILVAVLLSSSYFQYLIIFPLRLLAYSLQKIRRGEIEALPRPDARNEVSTVVHQFNATADFLAQNTFLNSLARKLESMAAEEANPRPVVSQIDATVMCLQIANFQYLASTHDEKAIVKLLSKFYFFAEHVSQLYNGTISSCAEGEVIIGFSSAHLEDEQCFYAMCAGQLLLQLQPSIAEIEQDSGPVNFKLKIAVHFGGIMGGLYLPMSGTSDNVNGKTVDLTREMCAECPDNSLLVSETAYLQAGGGLRVNGEEFSIVDDEYQIITYLCSAPMSSLKSLLERQASQLLKLYDSTIQPT